MLVFYNLYRHGKEPQHSKSGKRKAGRKTE